jgi:hypothetical protein
MYDVLILLKNDLKVVREENLGRTIYCFGARISFFVYDLNLDYVVLEYVEKKAGLCYLGRVDYKEVKNFIDSL